MSAQTCPHGQPLTDPTDWLGWSFCEFCEDCIARPAETLSLTEWDSASAEQKEIWLAQGTVIRGEDMGRMAQRLTQEQTK